MEFLVTEVMYTIKVVLFTNTYTIENNIVYLYTVRYTSFINKGVRKCIHVYAYADNITVV